MIDRIIPPFLIFSISENKLISINFKHDKALEIVFTYGTRLTWE